MAAVSPCAQWLQCLTIRRAQNSVGCGSAHAVSESKRSSSLELLRLQEAFDLPLAGRVAHFAQRFGFDLADALARDAELAANFFQRATVAVAETET